MSGLILSDTPWTHAKGLPNLLAEATSPSRPEINVSAHLDHTGRVTLRASSWHGDQDESKEGFVLDVRVSAWTYAIAESRAREAGFPVDALAILAGLWEEAEQVSESAERPAR